MSNACRRLVIRAALSLCTVASLPLGVLNAQQTLAATARISPRPITRPGADSGKHILSLDISGMPDFALRSLKPDQILLVDEAGRVYTPSMIAFDSGGQEQTSLAAAYLGTARNTSKPRYLFLVAPRSLTFELRVAGLKPVRVRTSLVGPAR